MLQWQLSQVQDSRGSCVNVFVQAAEVQQKALSILFSLLPVCVVVFCLFVCCLLVFVAWFGRFSLDSDETEFV